ncbi:MAG: SDR family oxidoreductase [Acidobacteria bacterium]|nr:SDR family oxidoreductase [Acidobacteriota bacterium]
MSSDRPVAIVSGAARGIGAATARRLAARGFTVALVDLPVDPERHHPVPGPYRHATGADLDRAAAACGGHGEAHSADVRIAAEIDRVVAGVVERHGRLDAVVAAAGAVAGGQPTWRTDDEVWRAMIDINLTGVFNLARAAVPALLDAPEPRAGRFVAIASAAAHHGLPQMAAYSAAKHGVAGLVRALAAELGGTGVSANAVAPGSTDTEMLRASAAIYGLDSVAGFAEQARIGRLIDPEEIAGTVEWLCVDAPGSLTGAVIDVDGGFRA